MGLCFSKTIEITQPNEAREVYRKTPESKRDIKLRAESTESVIRRRTLSNEMERLAKSHQLLQLTATKGAESGEKMTVL